MRDLLHIGPTGPVAHIYCLVRQPGKVVDSICLGPVGGLCQKKCADVPTYI